MINALQFIGGIILAFGYIPQIRQIIRTKSCKDLNTKSYLLVFLGVVLMEVYAVDLVVKGSGLMFLITNSMALVINGTLCALILFMGRKAKNESL